jgi:hypothetical protein
MNQLLLLMSSVHKYANSIPLAISLTLSVCSRKSRQLFDDFLPKLSLYCSQKLNNQNRVYNNGNSVIYMYQKNLAENQLHVGFILRARPSLATLGWRRTLTRYFKTTASSSQLCARR